jgi:hypothetical protein
MKSVIPSSNLSKSKKITKKLNAKNDRMKERRKRLLSKK